MAGAVKRGFPFRRRPQASRARTFTVSSPGRRGALVSSAARLDVSDRQEAKVQRMLRQGWQSEAWGYRDQIGELRYAINFLANCTARMRLYPAVYPIGGESDDPVALADEGAVPDVVKAACADAVRDLGNGRQAVAGMLHSLSTNKSVAGESYLLGRTDGQTGMQRWSVRSVDELVVYSEEWHLREIPDDRYNAVIPWVKLEAEQTVISRIWTPHPRFHLLADSPLRAMLDDCESLTILRRMIRATGRSRLARSGILAIPEGFSIKAPDDQDDDPEADPFLGPLTQAMMAPIVDEGTADAVVPIVIRGPGEEIDKIKLFNLAGTFDVEARANREELIGIIATTFDLPKEVIQGVADLNHWSAWQVDDNTFRHHVEPHVIACCDDLSGAYLRPYLEARGVEDFWVQRALLWYDPTELVTHPDQTKDALDLHDRLVISNEALLRVAGFEMADAPSIEEFQVRLLHNMRQWPPNVVAEFLHQLDPTMTIPPITVAGTIPGIKPSGVDTGNVPGLPAPAASTLPPSDSARPVPGPPAATQPIPGPPPITAAAEPNTGVMVALYPPPALAARLALPGGEPAEELHITLAFLGDASDLADPDALNAVVQKWAAGTGVISGEVSGVGLFTAGEDPVTYLSPDLPALPGARQRLVAALAEVDLAPNQLHGFTPHITLDYADRIDDVDANIGGTTLTFDQVSVVIAEERSDYTLAASLTAAGNRERSARLSRKLATIDSDLRARLQTAANAAMLRALERAGARLRTKVARDETLRAKIAHRANERVSAILGPDAVAATGLSSDTLIGEDWAGLRSQFMEWTEAAQRQAIHTALRIGELDADSDAARKAQAAMADGRDAGWALLSEAMSALSQHLLYSPDPNRGPGDWADLHPDTLVPAGTIRAALGVAGGASGASALLEPSTGAVALQEPVGQIGTGATIEDLISAGGGQREGYEWVHGPALHPFEPHLALDGVQFETFDDEALANPDDFPDVSQFLPGDHSGCLPAGAIVSGPRAVAATLRYWQGEMVELRLASGELFTATPNHPVLTPRGWVAVGELDEGDEVLRSLDAERIAALIPDGHQMPARIEEVAHTLGVPGGVIPARVKVAAENFHGDGAGSEIAVVWADRDLRNGRDASLEQQAGQPALAGADPALRIGLAGDGAATERVEAVGSTALGRVSGGGAGLAPFGSAGGEHGRLRGFGPADLKPGVDEPLADRPAIDAEPLGQRVLRLPVHVAADERLPVDTQIGLSPAGQGGALGAPRGALGAGAPEATLDKHGLQGARADVEPVRDALAALTGNVGPDRVLAILRRRWAGHVYNLETAVGWYIANGVVTHNCLCDFMPIYISPSEGES